MDSMGGMITYGLGGSACNALMFGFFHLKYTVTPVAVGGGGSVGSHVREGSQAATIMQHQQQQRQQQHQQYRIQRQDREDDLDEPIEEPKRQIVISVGWQKKIVERTYIVTKVRADHIVLIVNILNKQTQRVNILVSNIKRALIEINVKHINRK